MVSTEVPVPLQLTNGWGVHPEESQQWGREKSKPRGPLAEQEGDGSAATDPWVDGTRLL